MGRLGAVLLPLVALWPSGCSWIFVDPLPADDPTDYAHCTTSRVAPAFDTVFTGTNLLSALYVAGEDNVKNKGTAVTLGLGVAAIWLSSAIYGYAKTSACEAAREEGNGEPVYRPRRGGYAFPPTVVYPPPPAAAPPPPAPANQSPQQQDDDDPGGAPSQPPRAPPGQAPATRVDGPRFGG